MLQGLAHSARSRGGHSFGPSPHLAYNPRMGQLAVYEEMLHYTGFTSVDAANVVALREYVAPHFTEVTERFYDSLLKNESARAVFSGGEEQIARQRILLRQWVSDLFSGDYGTGYYESRLRIGFTHLHVGLPQQYMCMGMQLIWGELDRLVRLHRVPSQDEKLASLHKLIMLDLAVMLDSYKASYIEQTRRTERIAVEERLTQSEHLAEIGKLAASLAHEIKNPLAGINGAIQVIGDAMPPGDPRRAIVAEIVSQIRRLDAAVCDLLQYSRPTMPKKAEMYLSDAVRRVLMILKQEPSLANVTVQFEGLEQDSVVMADPSQIEQLLINLVINAAHASEGSGHIGIITESLPSGVRLSVIDSGVGMSREVWERAFEPFYTTKARGTGLGLSICKQIVESHGGTITIESERGKGTTVSVFFPASEMTRG